ncbi:MAG: acyl-CoA dehydrogenase [Bacteroidetes bacterium]|jgi:alkylation response protein AidB-like acyl-CoA dehydrogenase|nr:acyl-CoA dehydrogenase [Bacteroidota bacterium]
MLHPENHVLGEEAVFTSNFYESDKILRSYLKRAALAESLAYMDDKLTTLGMKAASLMDVLSQDADKYGPKLSKRTPYGENIDRIDFHPSYWLLLEIAANSEMFHVKYDPELKKKFSSDRHKLGFAAGQIYAMSELGQYCPLCMTDGAAYIIERHCSEEDKDRLLPKLSSRKGRDFYTGAMFLTEKAGGSDVGANRAKAVRSDSDYHTIVGEKWFCSNANADVMLVLARTDTIMKGTRGLSLFLVEKILENGEKNSMEIVRLKDKMGVRSMATAEILLKGTKGKLIGEEGNGFKIMAEMINMSRLYNAVAAIAAMRRGIAEVWQYLSFRTTFGKTVTHHALIRDNFYEIGSKYVAGFLLVWRAISAMDAAENGEEDEKQLMRILIPMAKWWTAEQSVHTVRACMELMGGNGYIEDFIMPKLFRDVNVLPIWEGSGNIIVLDILRAMKKTEGLDMLVKEIRSVSDKKMDEELDKLLSLFEDLKDKEQDTIETSGKYLFERLIHIYQMALIKKEMDISDDEWLEPALNYLIGELNSELELKSPPDYATIESLIGWDIL